MSDSKQRRFVRMILCLSASVGSFLLCRAVSKEVASQQVSSEPTWSGGVSVQDYLALDRSERDKIPVSFSPAEENQLSKVRLFELASWVSLIGGCLLAVRILKKAPPVKMQSITAVELSWPLSMRLLDWGAGDAYTLSDAVTGVLVLGATGSGKTSGSGRAIAHAYLQAGFGGLVLTAKAEERQTWERYCRDSGRRSDLIVFGADQPWRYNFLDDEVQRKGPGAGQTENIVNLFSSVIEIAERGTGSGGGDNESYWKRTNRQLCRNVVDLLVMAKGRVSIPDLYRLVVSAPTSLEQVGDAAWRARSFCFECLGEADKAPKTKRQQSDFKIVADFWMLEWPALSDKTRSIVISTFTSTIDVLNRGALRELFCGETNLTPDAAADGKIILIDLPVKEYAEVGQFAQVLWKYSFQRSIERRDVRINPRPVFLWADEAQYFVVGSTDMQFQTTCRSARVCTVLLSQNVSNFYAALGGSEKGKAETDSLFGCLNSKIFHCNGDIVTNEFAAKVCGRSRQYFMNISSSSPQQDFLAMMGDSGNPGQNSSGMSEQMEYEVDPRVFSTLRTGGDENNGEVDAILYQNGRTFPSTGKTWMPVTFHQW